MAMPGGDQESEQERINRELIELLNELRVALPGVQVLFAFLLAVPFSQRFADVSAFQKDVYFITLAAAALSSSFLIAPSSQHRMLFRNHDKEQLLFRANRYAIVGLTLLGVAFCTAVLLIADFLFSRALGITCTAVLAAVLLWLWVVLPMLRREQRQRVS
jgi:Family of unknown function (DUF6328)